MITSNFLTQPTLRKSTGKIIITPEPETVGIITHSLSELSSDFEYILLTPSLDCAIASKIIATPSVGSVVVTKKNFSDHARKMLHESGIGLVINNDEGFDVTSRCMVNKDGLTSLKEEVPVSAICSVLNKRNLAIYNRFGVKSLGYFRFKFCLFQLFSQEPLAYNNKARIEEFLYDQLVELGKQNWSSIRCVLSDLTTAELNEVGIDLPTEMNPDMGVRGPRIMEQWGPELSAICRFQEEFDTPVKISAPFISTIDEYCDFVTMVEKAGIKRHNVELGFTLEVPALAEELDDLFSTAKVDFMAIGTSDLFSLFNGVCRNNQELSISPTSNANIRLLRRVVTCAQEHGVHTFVCGEIRRNEKVMAELLLAGVGELICSAQVNELSTIFHLSSSKRLVM
ncbi:putative PEP-binding protein [Vibrio spartinae]|uniref:Phosphoenolpyruvate-protein phosphotransferase n=1 Tax=Vibrio spartinae TaxID=1918945 RepID=A0ABX6R3H9_9VIBR|nr:putative PEP-binding protein [Vibrio spartinae]QMV15690.1 Phosphoenolpyruvate-protein phosphotransferase [Vibrio spartinae]